MMNTLRKQKVTIHLFTAIFIALGFSAHVNASTIYIDEFTIIKNDIELFRDTFDNNIPPSDNGGNTQSYKLLGAPLSTESNGKLSLNASNGETVERPDAGTMQRQGARVKTNIDPLQTTKGLRTNDTFSVTGIFYIANLTNIRDRYGVRLTDSADINPLKNDSVGLSVMRTPASELSIVFHSYDQTAFTFTDLETILLDDTNDQIALTLS